MPLQIVIQALLSTLNAGNWRHILRSLLNNIFFRMLLSCVESVVLSWASDLAPRLRLQLTHHYSVNLY